MVNNMQNDLANILNSVNNLKSEVEKKYKEMESKLTPEEKKEATAAIFKMNSTDISIEDALKNLKV